MSDKCRTDPECYWRRLYDEALAEWHAEIVKRQDAQKSAREYGDLYVQARYALREAREEGWFQGAEAAAALIDSRIARPGMGTMEAIDDRRATVDAIRALSPSPQREPDWEKAERAGDEHRKRRSIEAAQDAAFYYDGTEPQREDGDGKCQFCGGTGRLPGGEPCDACEEWVPRPSPDKETP